MREDLPTLKAIILDFSSVNNVDLTSVQHLIDVRNQLDRWAAPDKVEWHLACITNRWTKRALVHAGFGYPTPDTPQFSRWKPIFSVAEIGGADSAAAIAEQRDNEQLQQRRTRELAAQRIGTLDKEAITRQSSVDGVTKDFTASAAYVRGPRVAVVHGLNRPLFHLDLTSALQSAIHNLESKPGCGTLNEAPDTVEV